MKDNGKKQINLNGRLVGEEQPVFIIAEAGVTNYGDFDLAKKQAEAAFRAEADIVKFQAADVPSLVSRKVSKRLAPELGYDWYQRIAYKYMPFEKLRQLQNYCNELGITFFATPHEDKSLDFLDKELNIPFIKVGSGESHNYEFLKNVGKRGKPIIISFGIQSDEEMIKAVEVLREAGTGDILVLHCVSSYPTPPEQADLSKIAKMKEILGLPVGISDHSVGWHIPLAAVAQGACAIEKHLTFDKSDPRSLDNPGALLPDEFAKMVSQVRQTEKAMKEIAEEDRQRFISKGRDWAGQSIVAAKYIPRGAILTKAMIAFKRPAKGGLAPAEIENVIGKKVNRAIEEDEQILKSHLD